MARDARFEDAPLSDQPLRLKAESPADLAVISALVQDAIGRCGAIHWARGRRRLVLLLNRFRWEDREQAERERRPYERVQTALSVENVLSVRARGLVPDEPETVVALLSLAFEPEEDGSGVLRLVLAGDGEIEAQVEWLDVLLSDVTRPWVAPSGKVPEHPGAQD